jgi:chromosome segregation ATPase
LLFLCASIQEEEGKKVESELSDYQRRQKTKLDDIQKKKDEIETLKAEAEKLEPLVNHNDQLKKLQLQMTQIARKASEGQASIDTVSQQTETHENELRLKQHQMKIMDLKSRQIERMKRTFPKVYEVSVWKE